MDAYVAQKRKLPSLWVAGEYGKDVKRSVGVRVLRFTQEFYERNIMYEDKQFTGRVISKLQSVDRGDIHFVAILTEYLLKRNRLVYDFDKDLFWVKLPDNSYQVAIWMLLFYKGADPEA